MHSRQRPTSIFRGGLLVAVELTAGAQERMPPLPRDALPSNKRKRWQVSWPQAVSGRAVDRAAS